MAVKKLYRSDDKIIGGVCAGFAEYTNSDPTLWRLLVACVIILSGIVPGLLCYLLAWIIMPEKAEVVKSSKKKSKKK